MRALGPDDTKVVRGVRLRRDPAREPCFTIAQLHTELHDYGDMSEPALRERLHRHMHNEMQSMEIAARAVADFPEAPWELRMELARQCWDETRHAGLLLRRLLQLGGRKGEFPVMNYEWGVTCMTQSLSGHLALQNRTFEGGEMDLLQKLAERWKEAGDDATAEILSGLLADEIQHVRFANRWLKRIARENPRSLLDVAVAVRYLKQVTEALAPQAGDKSALGLDLTGYRHTTVFANIEDRRAAEFTEEEIAELVRQEGVN